MPVLSKLDTKKEREREYYILSKFPSRVKHQACEELEKVQLSSQNLYRNSVVFTGNNIVVTPYPWFHFLCFHGPFLNCGPEVDNPPEITSEGQ